MAELLIQLFLGWPAMILSILFALSGILLKKWTASVLGALLLLPPAWYLSHYSLIFATMPLFLFGAAYFIAKGRTTSATLFVIPVVVAIAVLGIVVLSQ